MKRTSHRNDRTRVPAPRPHRLDPSQIEPRNALALGFPGGASGLELPRLSGLLRTERASLRPIGIDRAGIPRSRSSLALALSRDEMPAAVLVLPLALARHAIDLCLGRARTNPATPFSSGEEGAFLYLVDLAGADWLAAGGPGFTVRGLLAGTDQIADFLDCEIAWRVRARLETPELEETLALYTVEPTTRVSPPPLRDTSPAGDWKVRLCLEVGASRLDARDLGSAETGDLITLDSWSHPRAANAPLRLACGRFVRRARWLDPESMELLSTEESMAANDNETIGGDELRANLESPETEAGSLDVTVRAEVGCLTMSVDRALRLVPGCVLRLDRPVGTEVRLRAGDRVIARGELVQLDGRLGVEITEVP
ncbi:MAG: FliM/FliN family flagellar motor switch protein [Polyangia bacterium]